MTQDNRPQAMLRASDADRDRVANLLNEALATDGSPTRSIGNVWIGSMPARHTLIWHR